MTVYKYNTPKMRLLLYDYLRDYHPDINLNTNFRCLSPDHEDVHPSMSFSPKYNICKCWACGKKYDIFSLVAQDFNISPTNFMAQVSKVAELYPNYIKIVSFSIEAVSVSAVRKLIMDSPGDQKGRQP